MYMAESLTDEISPAVHMKMLLFKRLAFRVLTDQVKGKVLKPTVNFHTRWLGWPQILRYKQFLICWQQIKLKGYNLLANEMVK